MKAASSVDYLHIVISKSEIERVDLTNPFARLQELLKDRETIERFHQRVDISVSGFDDYSKELYEIPEVRNYIQQLDEKFPFWFYFLNNLSSNLQFVTFSCISCKVINGRLHFDTSEMQEFLNYHFARMNQICDFVGMTDEENKLLTEMVLANFG
jgi:hypothetical protein